jgi:alanyl-tRNA synthetase
MYLTGNQVRQSFLNFFAERGHTIVPSASLVPGGDSTLLFTNAGMVQFKDVFLGTDTRPYTRAADSQKCMRVSGKHNDLDTVGRDNTHHTFFEMLGNWSFGDYYKDEAIGWSWELLTRVWGLEPGRLYATIFEDDQGSLPRDDEAAQAWLRQPGFQPSHLITGGRKDNLWEMAETGPCGPSTEIHYDFGPQACDRQGQPGHVCQVNGDCSRIVEIWNNVFIQYNRVSADEFLPLPRRHVDTGMGFERIVSIIQGVRGNYETDLLKPLLDETQRIAGQTDQQRQANLTPYRVIADHVRAAAFLIADGVIPGNLGRNYVCRMIIRRAARFARKLDLTEPFMASVARKVIEGYQEAYPELAQNSELIQETLTREEIRFGETLDAGFTELREQIAALRARAETRLDGRTAFNLYATLGFPLEITRDILAEENLGVDEAGFYEAMEEHRIASGKGQAFGEGAEVSGESYRQTLQDLIQTGSLPEGGVSYDPYGELTVTSPVLAFFKDGQRVSEVHPGEFVEVLLAKTCFYMESGGQVSDTGRIVSAGDEAWEIRVDDLRRPAAGVIVHSGQVLRGTPQAGDLASAEVNADRRRAIMGNHTGTHLLHAALRQVLGDKVHQAGSAVDAERMRFDFNYPQMVTREQLLHIEALVNAAISRHIPVRKVTMPLEEARQQGAMALFGEKYGAEVRTVEVVDALGRVSFELCGGTHVNNTAEIGSFYIVSESSLAAGIRRIEAVTGPRAYEFARERIDLLNQLAAGLEASPQEAPLRLEKRLTELRQLEKENERLRAQLAREAFTRQLAAVRKVADVPLLTAIIPDADTEALRALTDQFRQQNPSGVILLGTVSHDKPQLIAAVTPDLIARGLKAGDLIKRAAAVIGGGGGGRPELAQAGGKDPARLSEALDQAAPYILETLK